MGIRLRRAHLVHPRATVINLQSLGISILEGYITTRDETSCKIGLNINIKTFRLHILLLPMNPSQPTTYINLITVPLSEMNAIQMIDKNHL